jgi:hypothetical protein
MKSKVDKVGGGKLGRGKAGKDRLTGRLDL